MVSKPTTERDVELRSTRLSVSFPADLYETLEGLAREKKVSLAWVVRDAAEQYVRDQWPLLEAPLAAGNRRKAK